MKLINLFDGSLTKHDVRNLIYGGDYIDDTKVKPLMLSMEYIEKSTNDPVKMESLLIDIMDHLYFMQPVKFEKFFNGYTKDQVNFIFNNKDLVVSNLSQQLKSLDLISTVIIYDPETLFDHVKAYKHYECNDCGDDFYTHYPFYEHNDCEECGSSNTKLID